MSVWQFILVVTDWGVSQWLLTKTTVALHEAHVAIKGRLIMSLFSTVIGLGLLFAGLLQSPAPLNFAFVIGVLGSFSQMSFIWPLQQRQHARAIIWAICEYALPVIFVLLIRSDAASGLGAVIVAKTLVSSILTLRHFLTARWSADPVTGLGPRAFGFHSAAWAMTSFASGTGELAVLTAGTSAATVGVYRIFQSIASLGSSVGFIVQAPLMRQSSGAGAGKSARATMAILGITAGIIVGSSSLIGLTLLSADSRHEAGLTWVAFVASSLAVAATLNTMSIVPATRVAKQHGSRYALGLGVVTSLIYWGLIAAFAVTDKPLLVPVAVLLPSIVGLLGNSWILRRYSLSLTRQEDAPAW